MATETSRAIVRLRPATLPTAAEHEVVERRVRMRQKLRRTVNRPPLEDAKGVELPALESNRDRGGSARGPTETSDTSSASLAVA